MTESTMTSSSSSRGYPMTAAAAANSRHSHEFSFPEDERSSSSSRSSTGSSEGGGRSLIMGPGAKIILALSSFLAIAIVAVNLHLFFMASLSRNSAAFSSDGGLSDINVLIISPSTSVKASAERPKNCSTKFTRNCSYFTQRRSNIPGIKDDNYEAVIFDDAKCSRSAEATRFCTRLYREHVVKTNDDKKKKPFLVGLLQSRPENSFSFSLQTEKTGANIFNLTVSYLPRRRNDRGFLSSSGRIEFAEKKRSKNRGEK